MTAIATGRAFSGGPADMLDVERARDYLAKCNSTDEVKAVRDKAHAIADYQRSQKAARESQNYAAEIALRAERRLGQLLAEMPKAKGGAEPGVGRRGAGNAVSDSNRIAPPTLADQGITKIEAHRWQKLAAIPERQFEERVADVKQNSALPRAVARDLLAAIAGEFGLAVVELPGAVPMSGAKAAARFVREGGDAAATLIEALADGCMSPAEGREVERCMDGVIEAGVTLREFAREAQRVPVRRIGEARRA